APPPAHAWARSSEPQGAKRPTTPRHRVRERRRDSVFPSALGFGFLDQAPELKSVRIDRFFDRVAREFIGWSVIRPDRAGGGPGTMRLRQPAAREVAGEGLQPFPRFRLENIDSHDLILSAIATAAPCWKS